ncbi:alkaline phosphatase family protein [Pseudomonas sp. Marseille-QA0892]
MGHKVILVVLDGLSFSVAAHAMGHLHAWCEAGRGAFYRMSCELPALSRPLYETILTGVRPIDSGVVHNGVVRLSRHKSVFHLAREAGLSTAAAAYHWVSELYNRAPFEAGRDRFTDDESLPIQHGLFYWQDHYPDSHLFADADVLRQRYAADFLLVHPMNIDDAGHKHGGDTPQYRNAARMTDIALAEHLQHWYDAGYQIMVTSDHGMNADRSHNGLLSEEQDVPLFVFGEAFSLSSEARPRQTELCGTICQILGAAHDKPLCPGLLS